MTMAWGDKIQKMDYAQRMAYAINAGVDVVSDTMDVDIIKEAYRRGLINDGRITESARRLLVPSFEMGLFEDPFRDPDAAARVVETTSRDPRVYEAHQKSVVLLKNAEHLLPLTDEKVAGRKIFVQVLGAGDRTDQALELLRRRDPGLQFTRDLKEAGLAIVFLSPANGPERRSPTIFDLQLHPETQVDIKRLAEIEAAVPTIVSINLEMPWLLGNVEPGTATLLAGFSTRADATLDVIRGRAHPSGRLPITLPRSEAAIVAAETNGPGKVNGVVSSDVPGWARPAKDNYVYTDATGAAYVTGFGLSY
jgi:beta-glucosidase